MTSEIALLLIGAFAAAGAADLSGTWRLDVENSRFDRQAPPAASVDRWSHKEPDLEIRSTRRDAAGQDSTLTLKYRIGSEGTNEVMGNPMRYKAHWEDGVLVIFTEGDFGGNSIKLTDKYTLSGDGRTLTLSRHYEGRGGPQDQTLIFRRQP